MIRFISGVSPSLSIGAGRFISQLEETFPVSYGGNKSAAGLAYTQRRPLKFAFAAALHYFRRAKLALEIKTNAFARTSDTLVIYHPQELGWERALAIIVGSPRKVWLYVLDMSFFCVRSYNYIPGENGACFRCLGGKFENIERMGCEPFPSKMDTPAATLEKLRGLAARDKVGFLLQGKSQKTLLERHFGPGVTAKHVGLWTVDFEADLADPSSGSASSDADFDVVFHGPELPAKGFQWTLEVAKLTPSLRYLFPMSLPEGIAPPSNCAFVPMRWESGLREKVRTAKLTLVPSLWSAVIEGALIKSICLAPRTGVIDIDGSYAQEIPADILLKLPSSPADAAKRLTDALSNWQPDAEKLARWKVDFVRFNRALAPRLAQEL
ncbi:MAG: hypothetical protein JST04_08210 [Bdellovibrionales bacterium]|nr:hypothetical protein [Bdellovibrionales bacterium]